MIIGVGLPTQNPIRERLRREEMVVLSAANYPQTRLTAAKSPRRLHAQLMGGIPRRERTEVKLRACTRAVAHSFVFDNVLVVERFEDLDFPLEVSEVLGRAVLQLLHRHHLSGAVLQGVVPAHLHAAEVALRWGEGHDNGVTLSLC